MASLGAVAHAATPVDPAGFAQTSDDDFTPQPNKLGPTPPHRSLQFDNKTGRWGLDLDMTQPVGRDVDWSDARIGLNYRIAPGLRTGVGVMLGPEQTPNPSHFDAAGEPAPRVRLETTFKF
ncbi:MAG TPA: hypothetical protein VGL58_02895 [Caulobacteraceae bacterium]|jgi:hypothetical protein